MPVVRNRNNMLTSIYESKRSLFQISLKWQWKVKDSGNVLDCPSGNLSAKLHPMWTTGHYSKLWDWTNRHTFLCSNNKLISDNLAKTTGRCPMSHILRRGGNLSSVCVWDGRNNSRLVVIDVMQFSLWKQRPAHNSVNKPRFQLTSQQPVWVGRQNKIFFPQWRERSLASYLGNLHLLRQHPWRSHLHPRHRSCSWDRRSGTSDRC